MKERLDSNEGPIVKLKLKEFPQKSSKEVN